MDLDNREGVLGPFPAEPESNAKELITLTVFKSKRNIPLHLMILPAVILLFIYCYIPMVGVVISFQKFDPFKGIFRSPWVGLANYEYMMNLPGIYQIIWNTLFIAVMKILAGLVVPVIIALILNEVGSKVFQRFVQTAVYFPYFLSWVILSGVIMDILSVNGGIVNQLISILGFEPIYFLGNKTLFPYVLVVTDTWKGFGFSTIVYMAALTGIDPSLYEACIVDGGKRWKQTLYVTLPGIMPTIILMAVLSLGNILNAGFEQVFTLYSPQVYSTGDIIDTFVYRLGLVDRQYSVASAVGLFKSVVSLILILASYRMADKFANYRIF
jgi:ABC-type polysaccharide transport system, permease component